jgi:hypothetical protein
MGLSFWIHGFWFAGLVIQPFLVAVLLLRGTWRKFPVFTAFCACSLLGDTIAFFTVRNRSVYTYVYLVYETVSVILALAVIYEIFTRLFASQRGLRRLARLSFRIVCLLLVLLGAAVIFTHSPIGEKGLAAAVVVVEEASRIVELGLIMFLFVFSGAFGLHWRQNVFGIVLGLGISAAVKLTAVAIVPHSYTTAGILSMAIVFTSDASLLIWLIYLLAPERVTMGIELPKRAQLEQWNEAIMELIHQ